jgi:aldehyde:ferredoxin oxidoreductase
MSHLVHGSAVRAAEAPGGYFGRYLHIDVSGTRVTSSVRPLPAEALRRFVGGSGLGAYLLLREQAPALDPLGPAAPLAFVFSPLVGSPLTTSAKFAVVSRSPLTGRYNDALAGSSFAISGKRTGYDALVVRGRAGGLSVLAVDDRTVRLIPAPELRGCAPDVTEQKVRERLGGDYQVAAIGPAGECLVRYATISHGGRHAGRGGSGAVLGAKRIKAVAVRGQQIPPWADPPALARQAQQLAERSLGAATAKYRELGTAANLLAMNRLQALPTRNFGQASFAGAAQLAPEAMAARHVARASCHACTIGCQHLYATATGRRVRLEYENLFALGSLCGISDPDAVLEASLLCDELGIDTISAGGTIGFAMECVERGLLRIAWLRFGVPRALLRALEQIGSRTGVGELLAEGSRRMALRLGPDAGRFACHVKGLEVPGYEPRTMQTMALGFAVGSRGADHNRSGAYEVDFSTRVDRRRAGATAVAAAIETEDRAALIDSLILCKFLRGTLGNFYTEAARMLQHVTGWDVTPAELRQTARRIVAARKLFNLRAGWTPAEDTLPDRFLDEALADDPARLTRPQLATLVRAYNLARGWTAEGWPDRSSLQRLQLEDL